MDSIPKNPVLNFHPDTMEAVRTAVNMHRPGEMVNAVTLLQEWLEKQHHLTKKDYPREYLERCLIFHKGSLEKMKAKMERMCFLRTLLTEFFEKHDAKNDFEDLNDLMLASLLPTLTPDHLRVFAIKLTSSKVTTETIMQMYRYSLLICEYMRLHDYCDGYIAILDYRDVNVMDYISATNITQLYKLVQILMAGHSSKIKGLHAIISSKTIDAFVNLVKKMFSKKIANRIFIHSTIDTIFEHVPKDILPFEFSGTGGSLESLHKQMRDELGTKKFIEHHKEMSEAKSTQTDKTKEKFCDMDLGIEGSFRCLNVD